MVESVARPVGRPRLNPDSGRSGAYVGFKTDDELKRKIETAGAIADRSLSAETRHRVETTFMSEDIFGQAMALAFGGNAHFAYLCAELANSIAPKGEWRDDEVIKDSLWLAVRHALDVLFDPEGTAVKTDNSGEGKAEVVLHRLGDDSEGARAKRLRFGDDIGERLIRRYKVVEAALETEKSPSAEHVLTWNKAFERSAARHAQEARKREENERG